MLEAGENITDQIDIIKKQFLSFSRFYTRLISSGANGFIAMDKETQDMVLHDVYVNNSKLEHLLRDIHENEINGDTIRQLFQQSAAGSARNGGRNRKQSQQSSSGTDANDGSGGGNDPDDFDEEEYEDSDE